MSQNRVVVTRSQRVGFVGLATAVLVAAVVLLNFSGGSGIADAAGDGDGEFLPDTEFELFEGDTAGFAEYQGRRPMVINFWASWCPACVAELPEFEKVHQELGDEVMFIGMANADQRAAANALADSVGLTYQLADDSEGEMFRSLGLIAMPSTVFVSADGRITEVFAGQLNEAALVERIEELQEAS